MIFGAGKLAEAAAFIKVGCWITVGAMAGLFYLFWTVRQPLQPFLRSLPHGPLRMALSEQLLVALLTVTVFAGAYGACLLQAEQGEIVAALVLRHGAASLVLLPLLALPIIQSHKDGHLLKIAVLILGFLLL
jgi:Na+-driven multidrug efflux pump